MGTNYSNLGERVGSLERTREEFYAHLDSQHRVLFGKCESLASRVGKLEAFLGGLERTVLPPRVVSLDEDTVECSSDCSMCS